MSTRRLAVVLAGFLLSALFANAASRTNTMRIKVLDSETRALGDESNGVPLNCEQLTFDAYCRSSTTARLVNTLLVQEGNDPPFRISCTAQSKYSRCVPLPKGTSFDARREKHGIAVYYLDDKGKLRKELYTLVAGNAKAVSPATAAAAAATAAPVADQPASAPAVAATPAPAASLPATVKCSFSSTPPGAEVTLDGRYVGSTPSVLGVVTGSHVVVMAMPGFAQWKRELTVASGSELTVNAVLEKTQ